MKKTDIRYKLSGLAAAALAYALVMWGLLLFLFFLSESVSGLPRLNILSLTTLVPLALGSLLPVFGAEYLLCKYLALPWVFVRLITPCAGFIIYVLTLIGFFPVLLHNFFILLPIVLFVLIQSGILLLSVCFTAIHKKIRRSRESSPEPDYISDPKHRPIKLPPNTEQVTPRTAPPVANIRRRDWKSTLHVAINVVVIIGGVVVMCFWFPSYQTALMFWPAVTQADMEGTSGNWMGRRAAGDIPHLTGLSQLEDGTYDSLTCLTVETDNLIPLSYYKLKDSSDSRTSRYKRARSRRRPLSVYTRFAGANAMYYGQYCVVELEDGSYIGAYLDSSYTTALGKVRLPIGQVVFADSVEKKLLSEASGTYPVPTDRLLMMHSDSFYEKIKLLDHGIRALSIMAVPTVIFGGWFGVLLIRKKIRLH